MVARIQNEYEAARAGYERALALFEAVGDRLGQANTLRAMGDVAYMQDDYDAARERYRRALALGEAIGNFTVRLNSLHSLGLLEKTVGDTAAACEAYRRTLELADSHPFFKNHPIVQGWREEYAELGCPDK
jgi:tetratricopeptide (TPR) repeat protein